MNAERALKQTIDTLPEGALATQEDLKLAFASFSELSTQLADSYQQLQSHVCELQQELVITNQEKAAVSEDKQNMAHRMQRLLELLPGGVVVLDESGRIEQCNPAAEDFLGDNLTGASWGNIIEQRFSPRSDDGHEISLADGRRLSIATRSLDGGQGQIVLLTDQTHTRELQDQLSRHNRLSTMGKMVAYLAHQIRTPLSSAMLYAGHINDGELDADQLAEFSAKLLRQIANVEQQVSDLLIFARGDSAINKPIAVQELLERLRREIAHAPQFEHIQVRYTHQTGDSVLNCNPQALTSALTNLVNNAREAMHEHKPGAPLKVWVSATLEGGQLCLRVTDNGPGIAREQISRVLEPFYSTKTKGTGLGLAVVQAVAESLGGRLLLQSPPQGGLSVCLVLPVAADSTETQGDKIPCLKNAY